MVDLVDILDARNVACAVSIGSKKKALQHASRLLSDSLNAASQEHNEADSAAHDKPADNDEELLNEVDILDALIERERLGSTALGLGVAVPHGHLPQLQTPVAALLTLQEGIAFESPDDSDVDIIFALLVPEDSNDDHLAILSQAASRFNDTVLVDALRQCKAGQQQQALEIFCQPDTKAS